MAQFVFMLPHAPDRYTDISESEFVDLMKDYLGWVEDMTAQGKFKGGEKLLDEAGKIVTSTDGVTEVHEGPFSEVAEILGGFMILEAADYDEAIEIARGHPHLKHNQKIIIRQTDPDAD